MNLQEFQYPGRRPVKSKSFSPLLSEQKLSNGIKLSIDHVKLPYINQAPTKRRVHHYHYKFVRQNIEQIKTDNNLYKGKVKLHVQDVQDLLSPRGRDFKPSKLKPEIKVLTSPNSKSVISQGFGVISEAVIYEGTPSPQHSSGSLEEIWNKFETALDEQCETVMKHRKCVKLFSKNRKPRIQSSME